MARVRHSNVVATGHQTYVLDSGAVDHYTFRDPETGLLVQRPAKASDEEIHARELAAMRRGLESVDVRLTQVGQKLAPYEDDPDEETIAKRRAGLESEREHVLSKIAELEALPEPTKGAKR